MGSGPVAEALVSDALREDYRRDGAVVLRGAFDERWLGDDVRRPRRPTLASA